MERQKQQQDAARALADELHAKAIEAATPTEPAIPAEGK